MEDWRKSSRMTSFLRRIKPNLPLMLDILKKEEVPAELIFITLLESNYFVEPGYPIQVSKAQAVGPWQFMPDTGRWRLVGLKVLPVRRGRVNSCDERADLARSTEGAGRYWKYLFDKFPHDPKLALVAYNWGPGNMGEAIDCAKETGCLKRTLKKSQRHRLRDIQSAALDFWTVKEFNMAPKESLKYVVNFVSAQFVGRDPARYGISLPDERLPKAPQLCRR